MTSITSILSGRLSHFPIMSILLLGFATMLTMLDIYIRSHKDMKKREKEKKPDTYPNWTLSNSTVPAAKQTNKWHSSGLRSHLGAYMKL